MQGTQNLPPKSYDICMVGPNARPHIMLPDKPHGPKVILGYGSTLAYLHSSGLVNVSFDSVSDPALASITQHLRDGVVPSLVLPNIESASRGTKKHPSMKPNLRKKEHLNAFNHQPEMLQETKNTDVSSINKAFGIDGRTPIYQPHGNMTFASFYDGMLSDRRGEDCVLMHPGNGWLYVGVNDEPDFKRLLLEIDKAYVGIKHQGDNHYLRQADLEPVSAQDKQIINDAAKTLKAITKSMRSIGIYQHDPHFNFYHSFNPQQAIQQIDQPSQTAMKRLKICLESPIVQSIRNDYKDALVQVAQALNAKSNQDIRSAVISISSLWEEYKRFLFAISADSIMSSEGNVTSIFKLIDSDISLNQSYQIRSWFFQNTRQIHSLSA